jgi:hypothetical protein
MCIFKEISLHPLHNIRLWLPNFFPLSLFFKAGLCMLWLGYSQYSSDKQRKLLRQGKKKSYWANNSKFNKYGECIYNLTFPVISLTERSLTIPLSESPILSYLIVIKVNLLRIKKSPTSSTMNIVQGVVRFIGMKGKTAARSLPSSTLSWCLTWVRCK